MYTWAHYPRSPSLFIIFVHYLVEVKCNLITAVRRLVEMKSTNVNYERRTDGGTWTEWSACACSVQARTTYDSRADQQSPFGFTLI